ncbi:hypothetical protein GX48_06391, partial [Paracoccidioides brasiliensis]
SESEDPMDIVKRLNRDPSGFSFSHFGDDGVLDANGKVIDSNKLTVAQLVRAANQYPFSPKEKEHLQNVWAKVEDSQVDESQIWSPPCHLLPLILLDREQV